ELGCLIGARLFALLEIREVSQFEFSLRIARRSSSNTASVRSNRASKSSAKVVSWPPSFRLAIMLVGGLPFVCPRRRAEPLGRVWFQRYGPRLPGLGCAASTKPRRSALPITSAGRFSPLGPLGIASVSTFLAHVYVLFPQPI